MAVQKRTTALFVRGIKASDARGDMWCNSRVGSCDSSCWWWPGGNLDPRLGVGGQVPTEDAKSVGGVFRRKRQETCISFITKRPLWCFKAPTDRLPSHGTGNLVRSRHEARPADHSFTWPGGAAEIGPTLARIVREADEVGFDSIWVMDHFFQIRSVGPRRGADARGHDDARLHGRALERARLGLMVGGVHYRQPGLWVKADDDARRPVRRPRLARASAPPGTRTSRAASGSRSRRSASGSRCSRRPSRSPTRCGTGERGTEARVRGPPRPARHLLNSPQSIVAAAGPDHDRRRRRAEDAAPGRAVRRRRPTSSAAPRRSTTSTRSCASTARRSAATRTRSSARPSSRSRATASTARRRSRSSTGSASSPTRAPSTSSSACARLPDLAALKLVGREVIPG